jgi:hypothetical protein
MESMELICSHVAQNISLGTYIHSLHPQLRRTRIALAMKVRLAPFDERAMNHCSGRATPVPQGLLGALWKRTKHARTV